MKSWIFAAAALSVLGLGLNGRAATSDVPPVEAIKVSISATDPTASESGPSTGLFTIHRTGATTSPLTVSYRVSGSAVAPGDYPTLPGTVVIPADSAQATILVTPVDDRIAEEDETVIVTLISPIQPLAAGTPAALPFLYEIGEPARAVLTIKDNDLGNVSLPTVNIRATDPTAAEPTNPGKITISPIGNIENALLVHYDVVSDPISGPTASSQAEVTSPTVLVPAATPGVDYEALAGSITIPPGAKSIAITIQPIDDQIIEGLEHVTLRVKPDATYAINQPDTASVFIHDNDPVNLPPVVNLIAPIEGATSIAPALITLRAQASDKDGTIAKVEFLSGDKVIGTATAAQADGSYTFDWKDVLAGRYTLRARATDQKGAATSSAAVHVVVVKQANLAPAVALVSPTAGKSFTAPATIELAAQASDKDGTVLTVEFFANGKSLGTVKANPMSASPVNPFQLTWKSVAAGDYSLTAKATDDQGAATTSLPVKIQVVSSTGPVVSVKASQPQVLESDPTHPGVFTVTRTGNLAPKLNVHYQLGGTAENGVDYTKLDGVVTIPAGENSATVQVVPVPDKAIEGKETVTLTLTQLVFVQLPPTIVPAPEEVYVIGTPRAATVTIYEELPDQPKGTRLIAAGATWKFLDNGTDQGTAWRAPSFDDSTWKSGPAQLGYGDGGEATVVSFGPDPKQKFVTTYFRHAFEVKDASSFTNLFVRLLRDDGAVVYLNGTEVLRSNMPDGNVTSKTLAAKTITGTAESAWTLAKADPKLLVNGANLVAVEVHQVAVTSSDISFDLELLGNADVPSPVTPTPATLLINVPKEGELFTAPADITLNATAVDPKGYISRVEFFANGQSIGVSQLAFFRQPDPGTAIQHNLPWKNVPVGKYILTATAKDSTGAKVTSPPVTIAVITATPPIKPMSLTNGHRVVFHGEAGRLYSIQISTDLLHWTEVSTVQSGDGEFEYADGQGDNATHRFYRAVPVD